jgi:hypothetical protein
MKTRGVINGHIKVNAQNAIPSPKIVLAHATQQLTLFRTPLFISKTRFAWRIALQFCKTDTPREGHEENLRHSTRNCHDTAQLFSQTHISSLFWPGEKKVAPIVTGELI